MNKCSCWEEKYQIIGWHNAQTPMFSKKPIQRCNGTKEREECTCDGDITKCTFYPEKRKEKKTMNTAEMWIKAQEDRMCYEMILPQSLNDEVFYQKDRGLFDGSGFQATLDNFEKFDDFMKKQWRLRTMTKSEAEAKFNIKIVGD